MKTLILALGNILLSDDGIGFHILKALHDSCALEDDVELLDGGTLSFTLAGPIADTDALIVIDAAQLQMEPGALQIFEGAAMDRFLTGHRKASVHEVGLLDLMTITQLTGHWPNCRALVVIQPEKIDWGEFPTQRLAATIPIACQRIHTLINSWRLP